MKEEEEAVISYPVGVDRATVSRQAKNSPSLFQLTSTSNKTNGNKILFSTQTNTNNNQSLVTL
jgi:hypothetical protein